MSDVPVDAVEESIILTPSMLKRLLKLQVVARNSTLIKGAPGIGKTEIVKQVCMELNAGCVLFHPAVSDPTDFKGFPYIGPDGKARFVAFGDLQKLIDATSITVAFLDDIGQAVAAVQAALMQLLYGGQINGHSISNFVTFIGATNRKEDKANVTAMLEPVKSRFTTIVELQQNLQDWIRWASQNNLPHEMISFIRMNPKMLNSFIATNNMTNSPCPRTIHNAAKLVDAGVTGDLEFPALSGAAGTGFAVEYIGFKDIYKSLPDPDHIIMSPDKAMVPEEPGALYAICGAVAARATEANMGNVVTYAERIPSDFSTVMILEAMDRNPKVTQTNAFIDWASAHSDFMY